MAVEKTLDVRGMTPPEPIVQVLDTIDGFVAGDRLKLIIDCEPKPLFRILERDGYRYEVKPGTDANYEIEIWME